MPEDVELRESAQEFIESKIIDKMNAELGFLNWDNSDIECLIQCKVRMTDASFHEIETVYEFGHRNEHILTERRSQYGIAIDLPGDAPTVVIC